MRPSHAFQVAPRLPEKLEVLRQLAFNLRWSWNRDAIDLFRRIDPELWEEAGHNPVRMLALASQEQLNNCSEDEGFLNHLARVSESLKEYMTRRTSGTLAGGWVAFFCAEFGVTECLPMYAGGLGVLSGDYLKSASDLGIPVVGVGILYRQGYFGQYLNPDGWQQEEYADLDFYNAPITLVQRDGRPLTIDIPHPQPPARAQVWCAQVGRVPLYLLDTSLPDNSEAARQVSTRLYAPGGEMRIQQEVLLGIGGIRALAALDIHPLVYHMNEGHSAFLSLERIRLAMKEHGLRFEEASAAVCAGNVFTTHTPVPAGTDRFGPDLMEKYLGKYIGELGIPAGVLMALGSENSPHGHDHNSLCTTVLAMRTAAYSFGVSRLHGEISRRIWNHVWPDVPQDEVPIGAVTNGVHVLSWVSGEMAGLFERYLGPRWSSAPSDPGSWKRVDGIPDEELWSVHERRRLRLVAFARRRLKEQFKRHHRPLNDVEAVAESVLDPNVLTIAFARRFAEYKRPLLLFHDFDRLQRIVNHPERPLQILFAGKAHPADDRAKEQLKEMIHRIREEDLRRRVVFLENYDMSVARYLIQGADVWLNTPRRPLEASGTSGMKAAANGVLNMSILEGWWAEGYEPGAGWAIGRGEEYDDADYQDTVEAQALYDLLEREVIPLFYDRSSDGLPRRWIAMMKNSIRRICPVFNCNRMVREYLQRFYEPALRRAALLQENNYERARRLAEWKERVRHAWPQVAIKKIETGTLDSLRAGSAFQVRALVQLGSLKPDDVSVSVYVGKLDSRSHILHTETISLAPEGAFEKGEQLFSGEVGCDAAGRYGFSVAVLPHHADLHNPYEMNLILWA
jgi:starch phosphorylase